VPDKNFHKSSDQHDPTSSLYGMTSNGIHESGISIMKEKYSSSATGEDISTVERNSQDDNSGGGESVSGGRVINTDDPFPLDPDAPVEERQLTIRALLVGCLLGAVISASNVYLGLKVCEYLWGNFKF
jgi:hypothetical protein